MLDDFVLYGEELLIREHTSHALSVCQWPNERDNGAWPQLGINKYIQLTYAYKNIYIYVR